MSCSAERRFETDKSPFKIGLGEKLTWRAGYNSWVNTMDDSRVKYGSSGDMTMEILLEKACAAHIVYLKKNSAPFFIMAIVLLLIIVCVLLFLITKAKKSNKTRTVLLRVENASPKVQRGEMHTDEADTNRKFGNGTALG